MVRRVERDYGRFQRIIRGLIRRDGLGKYITDPKLIGREGRDRVVIPLPQIELPRFRYGQNAPDVGQGDGDEGEPVDGDEQRAGNRPGEHPLEVELTLNDLVEIIGEELELPRIEPKGSRNIYGERAQYKDISQKGPAGLRNFKRSYRQALKRAISMGLYDPTKNRIILTPDDLRYRYPKKIPQPESSAVMVFMRDMSGSMDDAKTEIVRTLFHWTELWLRKQYRRVETCYLSHDTQAYRQDKETFYKAHSGGGTRISSAFDACADLVEKEYPPSYWNVYPMYASDGDNWGDEDNTRCVKTLEERLLPMSNIFCYTQVEAKESGFFQALKRAFDDDERVAHYTIGKMEGDAVLGALKAFMGKGK